ALMSAPGRLFNRQELMRAIWGDSAYRDPRGIDVHVRHLREKLETRPDKPELLLTVRGAGYRLAAPGGSPPVSSRRGSVRRGRTPAGPPSALSRPPPPRRPAPP